jgi:hypothetical protein
MELKFEIIDGKLTGGPIGQKPSAYDAIDQTTFQHPEFPVKLAFTVEGGKVVSLAVKQGDGNAVVFKKAGAQ